MVTSWGIAGLICASVTACGVRTVDTGLPGALSSVEDASSPDGASSRVPGAGGYRSVPSAGGATASNGGAMASNGGATASNGGATASNGGGPASPGHGSSDAGDVSDASAAGGAPGADDGAVLGSGGVTGGSGGALASGGRPTDAGPVVVPGGPSAVSFASAISGVTDAAWSETVGEFFLLAPAASAFYRVAPAQAPAAVSGPYPIPPGALAPHALAVSPTSVFTIVDGAIYRLPLTGASSGAPMDLAGDPLPSELTAAYAGGWLLIGDASGPAQALSDDRVTVDVLGSRGTPAADGGGEAPPSGPNFVSGVVSDGASFAFTTTAGNGAYAHRVLPGQFTLDPYPCSEGSVVSAGGPLAIFGSQVAWVQRPASGAYLLRTGALDAGVCGSLSTVAFGTVSVGAQAVGLIDDRYALVVERQVASVATIAIFDTSTAQPIGGALTGVVLGSGVATKFVMGDRHHALLVSGDRPRLIAF